MLPPVRMYSEIAAMSPDITKGRIPTAKRSLHATSANQDPSRSGIVMLGVLLQAALIAGLASEEERWAERQEMATPRYTRDSW